MNNLFDKIMAGVMSALIVGCFSGWVQINSRISMLEIQAQNDHINYDKQDRQMRELIEKVNDIQVKVSTLAVRMGHEDEGEQR